MIPLLPFLFGVLIGIVVGFIFAASRSTEVFLRALGKFADDEDVIILNRSLRSKVDRARR